MVYITPTTAKNYQLSILNHQLKTRTQGTDHAKITAASMLKAAVFICSSNWNLANTRVLFIDGIDKELCQSWPLFDGNGFFMAKANNIAIIA